MKPSRPVFFAASVLACLRLGLFAATPAPSPTDVVPELANASLPELREALNDVSDKSIESARHAHDLVSELNASVVDELNASAVNATVSTPEIDALRVRRQSLLQELADTEMALRTAILATDEYKERVAEVEAAQEKAETFATRRTAIRALLVTRRREASAPPPKEPAAEP